jgi:hypothetical protein
VAKISRQVGSTSQLVDIFIQNNSVTTGAGLASLAFGTSGLIAYYHRNTAAASVAISLATMTLGTWATGGFIVVDGTNMIGLYQLGIPNAALVSGADTVTIVLSGAANMAPVVLEIELTAVNNQSTAFGLSLAKTTNITGFNDIAATAIVSSGAITTSSGAVSTVTTVGTLTTYTGNTPQTGDAYARLGAPSGASVSADIAAVKTSVGSPAQASSLPSNFAALGITVAGKISEVVLCDTLTTYTSNTPQTGDSYARIGAPTGASVSADIAAIKANCTTLVAGVTLTLTQPLGAARALDSIADTSLTVNDALVCAVASVTAQMDASGGTSLVIKTASTGTTLRTKTLTLISPPSTVPDKAV